MAFCINCGAHNPEDAVFCLSCGQTLYHPPKSIRSQKLKDRRRVRVLILVFLVLLLGISVVVFSVRKTQYSNQNAIKPPVEPAPTTKQLDAAVLMIVGLNAKDQQVSQGSGFIIDSDGLLGVTSTSSAVSPKPSETVAVAEKPRSIQ